jgi:hypothetical protein
MNGESVKVGDAQGRESLKCVKFAARGLTNKLGIPPQAQTAQACLTNDVKGRVQKKVRTLASQDASKCLAEPQQLPDFGYVGTLGAGAAALIQSIGLTADLFGPDLDVSLVPKSQDKAGAKCQEVVQSLSHKVFKTVTQEVRKSVDDSLKGRTLPQATSTSTLSSAVQNAIEADAKNRIARAESRLVGKVERTCQGDLASLFPGTCSDRAETASDLAQCANQAARCRACKAAEGFGALTLDCEGFSDALCSGPMLDQQNLGTGSLNAIEISSTTPIGQEFTPDLPVLFSVDVFLRDAFSAETSTDITLNIRVGSIDGEILDSVGVNRYSANADGELLSFVFGDESGGVVTGSPLALVVGQTYVIELSASNRLPLWTYTRGDPYAAGRGIINGDFFIGRDFRFQTFGGTEVDP